ISTPGRSLLNRAIQPRIIGSWSIMFQVRKLIFLGACAIAGAARPAARALAPDLRSVRLEIMLSFLLAGAREHRPGCTVFFLSEVDSINWPRSFPPNRPANFCGRRLRGEADGNRGAAVGGRHQRFAGPEACDCDLSLLGQ